MISYNETRTLKLFFMGLNKSSINTINIPSEVLTCMRELVIFQLAYERISMTSDVFMELVDFIGQFQYAPLDINTASQLTRHTCYALDLADSFYETSFSSLRYKSNYLLKERHIEYYFELVEDLYKEVKESYTSIDITNYIMKAKNEQ